MNINNKQSDSKNIRSARELFSYLLAILITGISNIPLTSCNSYDQAMVFPYNELKMTSYEQAKQEVFPQYNHKILQPRHDRASAEVIFRYEEAKMALEVQYQREKQALLSRNLITKCVSPEDYLFRGANYDVSEGLMQLDHEERLKQIANDLIQQISTSVVEGEERNWRKIKDNPTEVLDTSTQSSISSSSSQTYTKPKRKKLSNQKLPLTQQSSISSSSSQTCTKPERKNLTDILKRYPAPEGSPVLHV